MIGHDVARVTIGCRPRSFSQHRLAPRLPVVLETIENILVPTFEVGSLARVLHDVEKELVASNLQILPVAVAHGALSARLQAPEKLARIRRRTATQHG